MIPLINFVNEARLLKAFFINGSTSTDQRPPAGGGVLDLPEKEEGEKEKRGKRGKREKEKKEEERRRKKRQSNLAFRLISSIC